MSFINAQITIATSSSHEDNWKSVRNERDRQMLLANLQRQRQQRAYQALTAFAQRVQGRDIGSME